MATVSLRQLGATFRAMADQPITRQTWGAIGALCTAAHVDRMERAVDPQGRPHKPLTRKWILFKMYGTTSEAKAAELQRRAEKGARLSLARYKGKVRKLAELGQLPPEYRGFRASYRLPGELTNRRDSNGVIKGGHSPDIWLYTGQSRRRTQATKITLRSVTVVINTPYSGYADAERQVTGVSAADVQGIHAIITKQHIDQFLGRRP